MPRIAGRFTRCRFGVAVREITPPVGITHANWGAATHEVAKGVHRPLLATASVIAPVDGDGPVLALVGLDHISLHPVPEVRELRRVICDRVGIEDSALLLNCSHTHGSATFGKANQDRRGSELQPAFIAKVGRAVGDALVEAKASRRPCWITWGQGRCDLAMNRDFWDADRNRFATGPNPGAPADDTVLVGRVTDDAGTTVATLVNYACHPTTLAWENRVLSPDYIGGLRDVLEPAFGAPVLFLQGASGELGPVEGFTGDTAVADRNGRRLGYAAASAIEGLPPAAQTYAYRGIVESGAPLGDWRYEPATADELDGSDVIAARTETVPFERKADLGEVGADARNRPGTAHAMAERDRRRAGLREILGDDPVYPTPVWVWRLGQASLVAIPDEAYSLLQTELRRRFAGTPLLVLGVTNYSIGYLSPAATYGTGLYQEQQSPFAAGCLEQTIEAAAGGITALAT